MSKVLSPWRIRVQQRKEGIHRQKPRQLRCVLQGVFQSMRGGRPEFSREERNPKTDKECPRRKKVNT
jgi:hypothetical protein